MTLRKFSFISTVDGEARRIRNDLIRAELPSTDDFLERIDGLVAEHEATMAFVKLETAETAGGLGLSTEVEL